MTKSEEYRTKLQTLESWDAYLLEESGLPGPRGNLELAQVVADEGQIELFQRYTAFTVTQAPVNSPCEFLAFCGVVGLGRLVAEGNTGLLVDLRRHASDPRWRVREGVAMALQRYGESSMDDLIIEMRAWTYGTPLEQRAAAAALCEPKLLRNEKHTRQVLNILDEITATIAGVSQSRSVDFLALRKGLGYCWSVSTAALPIEGKKLMEKWLVTMDKDISWIMQENLKKNRLVRMDAEWVKKWQA